MYQLKLCIGWFSHNQVTSHGHVKIDLAFPKIKTVGTYLKQRSFLNDPTGEYFDGHFCGCESKGGCRFGCGLCKPGCGGCGSGCGICGFECEPGCGNLTGIGIVCGCLTGIGSAQCGIECECGSGWGFGCECGWCGFGCLECNICSLFCLCS